ncbi:MAG TPA: gamma-glutamyl-gamma-aminobutyrate hydrolase family protein [Thermoanaerobaculia bacterium]|jgi:putative glutamine amidotransferase|nr:gamma-glutamyl-gamma-aminobutyrate hydrolase family protein [Thermoanaerobaculia bacterium]
MNRRVITRPIVLSCSFEDRAQPYLEALRLMGVEGDDVLLVTPERVAAADAPALAAEAGGLLLCGGPDLEPHHYGEQPHPHANLSTMPARDAVELGLLAGAQEAKTPCFAVCRGLQVTNAFLGGTLWQDLKLMWPNAVLHDLSFPRDALIHPVQALSRESELGDLLSREPSLVNSRHHQAIKELAPALQAVAVAPDGIVEAVTGKDPDWWLWAVQWHPENLVTMAGQRVLLERFRDQVRARAASQRPTPEPALR